MTVEELIARFPEIPADLHTDEILVTFASVFATHLETATKPSACSQDWTSENRAYMRLIGPMDIYRYGLSTRDRVVGQLGELVRDFEASPSAFEDQMLENAGT